MYFFRSSYKWAIFLKVNFDLSFSETYGVHTLFHSTDSRYTMFEASSWRHSPPILGPWGGDGLSVSSLGPDAPQSRHSPSSGKLQLNIIWIARPKRTQYSTGILFKPYVRSKAKNWRTEEIYRTETGFVIRNNLFPLRIWSFRLFRDPNSDSDTTYKISRLKKVFTGLQKSFLLKKFLQADKKAFY